MNTLFKLTIQRIGIYAVNLQRPMLEWYVYVFVLLSLICLSEFRCYVES